jgi:hypothetical protein
MRAHNTAGFTAQIHESYLSKVNRFIFVTRRTTMQQFHATPQEITFRFVAHIFVAQCSLYKCVSKFQ